MTEIQERIYQDYLSNKLDIVFNESTGIKNNNTMRMSALEMKHDYEVLGGFVEGFARVGKDGKFNFINNDGKLLSPVWFDNAWLFINGFATVYFNNKYNYLNTKGELLSKEGFDNAWSFREGFAVVCKQGKYNYINQKGETLLPKWYHKIEPFKNGTGIVTDLEIGESKSVESYVRILCFDKEGKELPRIYYEGYAIIEKDKKYNLINQNDELISQEWFDEVCNFKNGYAKVTKNNRKNLINQKGELISPKWYDDLTPFLDNPIIVQDNGMYNFINQKGELLSSEWFSNVSDFSNGFAVVCRQGKYNYINQKGELLLTEWYDNAHPFKNKFAYVTKNRQNNFINMQGKFISQEWYDSVSNFEYGLAKVQKNNKYNYLDRNGQLILDDWSRVPLETIQTDSFILVKTNEKVICVVSKSDDLDDYIVSRQIFGYKCSNDVDTFNIKYRPVKRFGFKYYLCLKDSNVYLFDRISGQYTYLGGYENIEYDDNFIVDKKNDKIYFIYENKFLDITEYYLRHLSNKEEVSITNGITDIYSKDEFSLLNMTTINGIVEKERERNKAIQNEAARKKEEEEKIKELKNAIEVQEKEARDKEKKITDAKNKLNELIDFLDQNVATNSIERIKVKKLLIQNTDYYEINPIYVAMLKYIDLSGESFENTKLNDIDFRNCNLGIAFNPQKVYNMDLKGCSFDKILFSPFINFSNVDIRGCSFSEDDDPTTKDIFSITFQDAIYDETTTYNGIPFTELIEQKKLK